MKEETVVFVFFQMIFSLHISREKINIFKLEIFLTQIESERLS